MRFLRAPAGHSCSSGASRVLAPRQTAQRRGQQPAAASTQLVQAEPQLSGGGADERMAGGSEGREGRAGAAGEQLPAPSAEQTRSGGALSLAAPQGKEQEVPRTLPHALSIFLAHPSTLLILAGLAGLAGWRAQLAAPTAADAAVAGCVVAGWTLQEWAIHRLLLHSSFDWLGRRIHIGHHQRPYYHVSIDDPPIVLGFMAASLAAFWAGLGGGGLAATATIAYYSMGLAYEFTHYIVHTRYMPRSRLAKRIRMHHLLHHTRNEAYWLAFTAPQVDRLFGTSPEPAGVRMSELARASLKAVRGAG